MEFKLAHKGFSTQEVLVSVFPSGEADKVVVKATMKRELLSSDWQGHYSSDCIGGGGLHRQYEWDTSREEWGDETGEFCSFAYLASENAEKYLKDFSAAFYTFHKKQDATAQLTIETIRNLRVEDIVGEISWEVVKTTSRRGTSRAAHANFPNGGGRR